MFGSLNNPKYISICFVYNFMTFLPFPLVLLGISGTLFSFGFNISQT
jgi:hypothetical protein